MTTTIESLIAQEEHPSSQATALQTATGGGTQTATLSTGKAVRLTCEESLAQGNATFREMARARTTLKAGGLS